MVDPIWNQKYDTKPPGAVPDFDMMHKWVWVLYRVLKTSL